MGCLLFLVAAVTLFATSQGMQLASPNITNPCFTTPSSSSCSDFYLTNAEIMLNIAVLCDANATNARGQPTSMPFMVGCELATSCGISTSAQPWMSPSVIDQYTTTEAELVEAATYAGYMSNSSTVECDPFTILATLCDDMPGMSGCAQYTKLCVDGTAVEQCITFPPLGVNATSIGTVTTWDNVQYLCSFHADHLGRNFSGTISSKPGGAEDMDMDTDMNMGGHNHGRRLQHEGHDHGRPIDDEPMQIPHGKDEHAICDECYKTSNNVMMMAVECPTPFSSYAELCGRTPEGTDDLSYDQWCEDWRSFCESYGEAFPIFCEALLQA